MQDRGDLGPGEAFEGLGLVGEEDSAVRRQVLAPGREAVEPHVGAGGGSAEQQGSQPGAWRGRLGRDRLLPQEPKDKTSVMFGPQLPPRRAAW